MYVGEVFLTLFNTILMVSDPEINFVNLEIHCKIQGYKLKWTTMNKEKLCFPVSCFPSLILSRCMSLIWWTDLKILSLVPCVKESDDYATSCWPFSCIVCPQEDFRGMCFINGIFYFPSKIVNTLLKGIVVTHLQHSANYKLDLYGSTYFTGEGSVP